MLAAVLLGACVSHQPLPQSAELQSTPASVRVISNITYTPEAWPQALGADLYLPQSTGPHPGMLMVHGGGWARRSRADVAESAQRYAEAGFAVLNISHRFAPDYHFPAQVEDLQQAMRWLHAQARQYRIDTRRIAGYGYSSGAHLVAMLATLSPGEALFGGPETRLQAAILGGTPADLRRYTGGSLVPEFIGASHSQAYPQFVAASPVTHVSADDPPMFLYHGRLDTLVSADYAREFKQALDAAGVPNELYLDNFGGHVTAFVFRKDAEQAGLRFILGQWQESSP